MHRFKCSAQQHYIIGGCTSCKHDRHADDNQSDFSLACGVGWDGSAEDENKTPLSEHDSHIQQ